MHKFANGDQCFVRYGYGSESDGTPKVFEGVVLWTEQSGSITFAYVRPLDSRFTLTFGSSRDMSNGYKGYIVEDGILCKVWPTRKQAEEC